jgi:DNA-directed RNA polymerase specialized sigma24 family protein
MSVSVDPAAYEAALSRLPDAHALALRLTDAGVPDEEMCRQLGIEPESLEPLLDLARRKLRTELALA